jgi:tetratricopeptide (TPR) repeat protein
MTTIDDSQQIPKLIGIFTDEHKLIERLRNDILLTYRHDLSITTSCLHEITTEQSLTSLHGNTLMFMWNQLFIYYLVRAYGADMAQLKNEMINQCRLEYAKDQIELRNIEDFEAKFEPDQVLACYTKSSFAYRLLNKALRTRNINLICKFIYLIILLHEKLQKLSKDQEQVKPRTVYRGQIMKENNRARLKENIGFLISLNTFMSTSTDENVARAFIEGAKHGVIFKINTGDMRNNTLKPFADISEFSLYPDEKEVLFFVGAVFRIDSVIEESNSIWIIEMTLSNETDEQIKLFTDDFEKQLTAIAHVQDSFMKTDDFTMAKRYYTMLTTQPFPLNGIPAHMINQILAYFCSNLGNYKKAIELYENLLLEKTFIDKPKRIVLNIIIGYNYFNLSQYKNALRHYGIALSLLDNENLVTGELYNHIGDTRQRMNNFDVALLSYQEAERILERYQDNSCLRDVYLKISELYQQQADFDDALIY